MILEEDVVDVIVDTDISVSSSEVELVEEQKTNSQNATDRRRRREYRFSNLAKSLLSWLTLESLPFPFPMHSPPLPPPLPFEGANIGVSCHVLASFLK